MNEEALEILRRILENSDLAVAVSDTANRIILFNRGAERLTGYAAEEVLGVSGNNFYKKDDVNRIGRALRDHGKVDGLEVELKAKDGSLIPTQLLVTRLWDVLGRPIGSLAIAVDLRPRKALERALRQARARADFFSRMLSQDVGGFVAALIESLEAVGSAHPTQWSDRQQRALEVCLRQTRRIRSLLDQMVLLEQTRRSRLPSGRIVELRSLVREAWAGVEGSFGDRNVQLHLEVPAGARVAVCALFERVFVNLFDNAVGHSLQQDAEVWVTARRAREGWWRVEVADNGPGIPDSLKQKVFERFSTRQRGGSGVGLCVVRHLVERCSGRVWVEDRVDGRPELGARFVMELPENPVAAGGPQSRREVAWDEEALMGLGRLGWQPGLEAPESPSSEGSGSET